ncbi:ABC transporter permease [Maioricimonas rarisocia]|nr:iron export ABC transporter permease subunit FetB [Maioricimonas rarisocia]
MNYHDLTYLDVAIAAVLILINGIISLLMRLDLEKRLLVASVRTVVQLLLVGLVLKWIFARDHPAAVAGLMLLMSCIAGTAAVRRTDRRFKGIWTSSLIAVMTSSWIVIGVALTAILSPNEWLQSPAQYAIPLMGMILGNTLNGISLGLDRFTDDLVSKRNEVELLLCLGGTRWDAARPTVQSAIRTGMIPIINSMMVVGLVSLPGMMTGQILAGAEPMSAVRYQIVIMFLIAAGSAMGTTLVVLLSFRRLFNARHQFLADRLTRR